MHLKKYFLLPILLSLAKYSPLPILLSLPFSLFSPLQRCCRGDISVWTLSHPILHRQSSIRDTTLSLCCLQVRLRLLACIPETDIICNSMTSFWRADEWRKTPSFWFCMPPHKKYYSQLLYCLAETIFLSDLSARDWFPPYCSRRGKCREEWA